MKVENFDITKVIQSDLDKLRKELAEVKKAFDENFLWNLSSYLRGYIIDSFIEKRLTGGLNFMKDNPDRILEWLDFNIERIITELLTSQLSHSTNQTKNLQEEYEREASQKLLAKFVYWKRSLTDEDLIFKLNNINFI